MRPPPSSAPPRFRYVGGDHCLDLVNTVDWAPEGPTHERLVDYPALVAWAEGAGLHPPADSARLLRYSLRREAEATRVHAQALRVRALIRDAALGVTRGAMDPALLDRLNEGVQKAFDHRRLVAGPAGRRLAGVTWEWEGRGEALDAPLWPTLLAAAMLFTSSDAERIRVCEGPACGWMYVDRSRNGFRRWCAMDMCGGREKARRHYARVRAGRDGG